MGEREWRTIDSAPVGKIVIAWADCSQPDFENRKMATACLGHDGVWEWDGQRIDKSYQLKPTHWQPLPTAPLALTVVHEELEPDSTMHQGVSRGWPAVLSSLKTLLETGHAMPMTMKRWHGPPK